MQWRSKVDPNPEPGTNGVTQLLSFGCRQIQDGFKQVGNKEEESARVGDSYCFFCCCCFLGGWGRGVIHLIHVTLHLRLAASSTCSETTNPFASHGLGQLCPSMWTDTVCGVRIICLGALGLSCAHNEPARNHSSPETDSAGSQTAHLLYQSPGETSGTRM